MSELPRVDEPTLAAMKKHFGHPFAPEKAVLSLIQEVRERRDAEKREAALWDKIKAAHEAIRNAKTVDERFVSRRALTSAVSEILKERLKPAETPQNPGGVT